MKPSQKTITRLALFAGLAAPALLRAQVNGPDITVSQTSLSTASVGGTALIRITVTNIGNASATNFLVIGGVGDPATLNSISGAGATCAKGRNAVYTCSLPGLIAGGSTDLLLSAKIGAGASFTSNATLNSGGDVNLTNNRSTLVVPIQQAPPDVQMSGSASTGSPSAGAQFDYRFQVKVGGSVSATGVVFSDALPAELSYVTASASNGGPCSFNSGVVQCALGDMAAGSQALVTLTVLAPPTAGTAVSNTGTAFAFNGSDNQPGNNTVTVNITTR